MQGKLRKLERMDVDISLDDTYVVCISQFVLFATHQAQGTYLMDVDANVDVDIDMDEFYSVCICTSYFFFCLTFI